jgi:hypothetical protein
MWISDFGINLFNCVIFKNIVGTNSVPTIFLCLKTNTSVLRVWELNAFKEWRETKVIFKIIELDLFKEVEEERE